MSTPPPRSERNIYTFPHLMRDTLRACHHRMALTEESVKDEAFQTLIQAITHNDKHDTDDLLEIVRQVLPEHVRSKDDSVIANLPLGTVIIATTYWYRALKASTEHDDKELAWSYMADCCYWAGVAVTGMKLGDVRKRERKELASKGAETKNRQHAQMKAYAYQLVREGRPPEGWATVKAAAGYIEERLDEFTPQLDHAEDPAKSTSVKKVDHKTILNWLTKMPGRAEFFKKNRHRTNS